MSNKTKAALQGRQCQNSNQIHSQLITQIDHVKQCSTVTVFPVSLRLAGGCLSYISGDTTSPKFLGGVITVVCNAGILTAPLAQFVKASHSLNQRRNSALGDIENYHLLTQIFGAVGGISHSNPTQPFGSIPKRSSSLRPSVLSQFARLMPSLLAAESNCAFSSGFIRILNCGDCPSPLGLLSRLIVDKWPPIKLTSFEIGGYLITVIPIKTTPRSAGTHAGRLTKPLIEVTIMACFKSTQTHPKFQYRFLALNRHDKKAKPCRLSVEATTEHEARRILAPHFILSFAARLPVQEVRHV